MAYSKRKINFRVVNLQKGFYSQGLILSREK